MLCQRFAFYLIVYINCILYVSALYEDQIEKFDWRQQHIGRAKFIHFNQRSRNILAATEQNVLASLNSRNGQLAWRQVLEKDGAGEINVLETWQNDLITVSGSGDLVRSWQSSSGLLNWEAALNVPVIDKNARRLYNIIPSEEKLIIADIVPSSHLQISTYFYKSESFNSSVKLSAPWLSEQSSCEFIGTEYLACFFNGLQVYPLNAGGSNFRSVSLENVELKLDGPKEKIQLIRLSKEKPLFGLLGANNQATIFELTETLTLRELLHIPKVVHLTLDVVDNEVIVFTAFQENKVVKIRAYRLQTKEIDDEFSFDFELLPHQGFLNKAFVFTFNKKNGGSGCRAVILTSDHSLTFIQQPGKAVWSREESLSSILSVKMIDLPLSETQAAFEKEFGAQFGNLFGQFVQRLGSQLMQMQKLLLTVLGLIQGEEGHLRSYENRLYRDEFNLHKMIVVTTAAGKFFGLDSLGGNIIWRNLVPDLVPFEGFGNRQLPIFVQRTSAHGSMPAVAVVVGRNKVTGEGVLVPFNPISGDRADPVALGFKVVQVTLLPQAVESFIKPILMLDQNGAVHMFPRTSRSSFLGQPTFLFTSNPDTGAIIGYRVKDSPKLETEKVWSMHLPRTQRIIQVVLKRSSEHVHSLGRVMGDRSVLYKYLNPNLAVVVTEGMDGVSINNLYVYLIDTVSGSTIYSTQHKKCREPVHVVHSENWVVYSYRNEKSRRVEISVLELYEGKTQSNTTAFSSFAPPPSPMVEKQSYIFPSNIDTMTATITEKGITNKHLLVVLPSGAILELPKFFLDPRRPLILTHEQREEGIPPYVPELPIPSESIINYNHSVFRIRDIYTTTSGLESICLVLAYGLDLFYTRVAPSRTFDLLKDDFDHYLILAVLLGLIVASYVTKRLAARKALRQAWK